MKKTDPTLDLDYSKKKKKKKKIVGRSHNFENARMDNSLRLHDAEWSETLNKLKKLSKTAHRR